MTEAYVCWKCGGALSDLLLPLPRHEECPHCRAQLHVCRMCVFFDATLAQQCREPVADLVSDKLRANFCGYFQINPHAFTASADQAVASHQALDAMFKSEPSEDASETRSDEAPAHEKLEELFKK